MFTRCPHCDFVHALNASLLAHAGGAVRCGRCNREFSALAFLFDCWPDKETRPPAVRAHGNPPVLGYHPVASPAEVNPASFEAPVSGAEESASTDKLAPTRRPASESSLVWKTLAATLLVLTLANLGWTFREALLAQPAIRDTLTHLDLVPEKATAPFADPSKIHLVSRDLHLHPTLPGVLVLSATFVSLSEQAQPYPVISILLLDAENRPLAGRSFEPAEYLPKGLISGPQMTANVHVPILLEFADPGDKAVGFEIAFN